MQSRLEKKPERLLLKNSGIYFEGHHIIPKSKGGTGTSSRPKNNQNIVLLTAREHFLAHWILWRIYRDRSTALSFHKMISSNENQNRVTSSRGYEEAKEAFRLTNIGNKYGKGKNKVVSDEQKKKQSKIMKGRYLGDLNPSKKLEVREKISKKLSGKKKNESHIEIMRQNGKRKYKCPYCSREVDLRNSKKWHFDNCLLNPEGHNRLKTNFIKNNKYSCKKIINLIDNKIFDSVVEASLFYEVHPSTIKRWINKGKNVTYY